VEFPGYSPVEIEHQVEAVLATHDEAAKDIVFACSNSKELPFGDWQIVPVACAAMVPASALLAVVAAGARSVGILRCVEECAQRSRETVNGRIDYAQSILGRAGLNPNRVLDLPSSDSDQKIVSPSISSPTQRDPVSIDIFGRTAASNSILALNARTPVPIEPFVHPYSPVAIPIINSSTCTMCGTCSAVCPTGALTQVNSDEWVELTLDAAKCMACNECVAGCPEISNGAIELELRSDVTAMTIGPVILNSDQTVSCDSCKNVFTSARTLGKLESLLGEDYAYETYGALCPECRTLN
jgi:ferredoxin